MASPVDVTRERVEVAVASIRAARDAPEDAARQPRFDIGDVRELDRAAEADAALGRDDVDRAESQELVGERGFEAARTRREEGFRGQNGFTTTRITTAIRIGSAGISFSHR